MDSKILTRLVVLIGCSTLFLLGVLVGGIVNRPLDVGAQSRGRFKEVYFTSTRNTEEIVKLLRDGWEPFSVASGAGYGPDRIHFRR